MEFKPFPKIARLHRACTITEKIDGTNAQVYIVESQSNEDDVAVAESPFAIATQWLEGTGLKRTMFAGSRTRWITPPADNFGFASWVAANHEQLFAGLGNGQHFGEWWGSGIQRRYGLSEKRFSLFNTGRWLKPGVKPPDCCSVVPVLYEGQFSTEAITETFERLRTSGSVAAPGFMNPEGIVVFHAQSGGLFKQTFEHDATGKPE